MQTKLNTVLNSGRFLKRIFTLIDNKFYALNNGWVLNCNPLENFATSDNFYYLRRRVYIWGDLVKLRFGKSKKDSPNLWKHMQSYI